MGTKELLSWQVPRSSEAVAEFREAAESGDAYAQTEYGKCILFRKGTAEDIADAYQWFEKAAAQSNEVAKMYVGHCKLYGIGVEEQKGNGYTMLDDALNYNYPGPGSSQSQAEYSQFEEEDLCQLFWDLGDALENGIGVFKNYGVAVYYFNMLAEWGHPEGAERLKHYKKGFLGKWKKID